MARTASTLPGGARLSDFISLGVLARTYNLEKVKSVVAACGKQDKRLRELPAHVMVYYAIALPLFSGVAYREVLRCLLDGIQWIFGSHIPFNVTGKSGISQARTRLGWEPLKRLYDEVVQPIAVEKTQGAWYKGLRLVSIDGSTLDVADEAVNEAEFGRPGTGRGNSAFPQLRFVSLVENGTHVLFATEMADYRTSELALARSVLERLEPGMLCLADRGFVSFDHWNLARERGAELIWRTRKNARLPRETILPDGSYLSRLYPSEKNRREKNGGVVVRVIEYTLEGIDNAEPIYRLITTILDHENAPAADCAALYHERWEIESAFDELKTHLRGKGVILRSKTPDLVRQEFYGLMLAHFAIRGLIHEAALKADEDPDRISFVHTVRVIRRKLPAYAASPPREKGCPPSGNS